MIITMLTFKYLNAEVYLAIKKFQMLCGNYFI